MRHLLSLLLVSSLLLPFAAAGTAEAPELADAAGDCQYALGNEYLDIVSAWISDETATHFAVNLALAKWTPLDPLAAFAGVTVQFQHQGKQFGIAAWFDGQAWDYSNGYIDLDDGSASGFTEAQGSFTPGTPAILTVQFDKSNFPHADANDNRLVSFEAGTVDFKPTSPAFLGAPVAAPPLVCDRAESDATYTFQVGGHSGHDMGTGDGNATQGEGQELVEPQPDGNGDEVLDPQAAPGSNDTPGFTPALLALALLASLGLARRR